MRGSIEDFVAGKRRGRVTVVGGGYVGLPLAVEIGKLFSPVVVYDVDQSKVKCINNHESYISDVASTDLMWLADKLKATSDPEEAFSGADIVVVCVPTPLQGTREPDLSYVMSALDAMVPHLDPPCLVCLESTVYPGFTRDVVAKKLSSVGRIGEDVFVSFSPERIDPSNMVHHVGNTPKVVGGVTPRCTELAAAFYSKVIMAPVVPVPDSITAEMVKLLENTFRTVNIALANEFAQACHVMGVDVWRVVEAAKTKPMGFMPFWPGPGIGGHCLSGEEYVVARQGSHVMVQTIKEFCSNEVPAELLSMQKDGTTTFAQVLSRQRRMSNTPLLKITTNDSRSIKVTAGHIMLVVANGEQVEVRADELEIEDELPLALNIPSPSAWEGRIDTIDMVQKHNVGKVWVRPKHGEWRDHADVVRVVCHEAGIGARDVLRSGSLPLELFLLMERKGISPVNRDDVFLLTGRGSGQRSHAPVIDIDEDFARLIGFYVSEGCISQDKKTLRTCFCFASYEEDLIDDCCALLTKIGEKFSIYRSKQWRSVTIKVTSRFFGTLLRDVLGCGSRSEDVALPSIIMGAPTRIREQALAGALRGDGGVSLYQAVYKYTKNGRTYEHRRNSIDISYFSSSPVLFQQILLLIQSIEIVPQCSPTRSGLLNIHGAQAETLEDMFAGGKSDKIASYREHRSKSMPPKAYTRYPNFVTVKVENIEKVEPEEVFSVDVAGDHTFVTSYGIAVHNCIPVDPIYLSWKLREAGLPLTLIEAAEEVNGAMPRYVVRRASEILNDMGFAVNGAKILIVGVSYKRDVNDTRESPALEIIAELKRMGAQVSYHDPLVPYVDGMTSREFEVPISCAEGEFEPSERFDLAIITTDHGSIEYKKVAACSDRVLDTRDVMRRFAIKARKLEVL